MAFQLSTISLCKKLLCKHITLWFPNIGGVSPRDRMISQLRWWPLTDNTIVRTFHYKEIDFAGTQLFGFRLWGGPHSMKEMICTFPRWLLPDNSNVRKFLCMESDFRTYNLAVLAYKMVLPWKKCNPAFNDDYSLALLL